jgi:hypothetical protein
MPDDRREPRQEWDGIERRTKPHEYELRSIIREELTPIQRQQQEMRKAQIDIQDKIREWELGAKWFRYFIMGTVGIVTVAAGAYEWLKDHLK